MPDLHTQHWQDRLAQQNTAHLIRLRRVFEERSGATAKVDGKTYLNFCSYDYLDLATHPLVKKAFADAAMKYGLGSSGSALVSGYTTAHEKLEMAFAEFLNRDRAILFNSGYHANLGVLTTFAGKNHTIIADKYAHASLNAGAMLSGAKFHRYRHHDLAHATRLLEKHPSALLVTESVFSMQGTLTHLPALSKLAKQHQAMLIVDDAHGVGVLGQHGGGICEHFQLSQDDVPCLVTPLGKAFGSFGAIVSGKEVMIETLLQFAGSYRYCTALPPAVCAATLATLELLRTESWRREKLQHLSAFFTEAAHERQLPLASNDPTPLRSIIIGDNEKTLAIQAALLEKGMLVACIRPPTVPANKACLRIPLSVAHEEAHLLDLLDQIAFHYESR